ncbi:PREDICTED: inter-alpha-trypsin inhibitor heavy chain H2 [Nanorana parkeri]|uniref:inter-alpha-trypsin inhibitor heavy chain H2 n=1 Tax=Nanorana parkeri TaxID=125878 RepID=UPI000854321C|nr:PREDICTED: inter-alpha-trypsin inhibitor heavy chain H2 [Nanorana parkeri]
MGLDSVPRLLPQILVDAAGRCNRTTGGNGQVKKQRAGGSTEERQCDVPSSEGPEEQNFGKWSVPGVVPGCKGSEEQSLANGVYQPPGMTGEAYLECCQWPGATVGVCLYQCQWLGVTEDLGQLMDELEPHIKDRIKRSLTFGDDGLEVPSKDSISLYSYKVESTITSHFVNTMIQSKVVNTASYPQSLSFDIQIPKGAFINNFTMNVNGITFSGSIKEKSEARGLYAKARARGKSAGLLRTNTLDMENFKADLNVPGGTKVQFEINYQEALQRKLGTYEHVLYLQPGRIAKHFEVDIYILEPEGLGTVNVVKTVADRFSNLIKVDKSDKKAHISFRPTVDEQRECPTCPTTAVDGRLSVKYDVNREKSSQLQVFNGYFLHFFAPENQPPLPKNILFVIDVSGSMWGIKMKQTVEAMKSILDDLRTDDQFGIVDFNHNIRCWKDELVYASPTEKESAKRYVQNIQAIGGTNINEALLRAIFILKEANDHKMLEPNSVSLIVLVSDGDPTVGELKLSKILKNVKVNNRDEFSLHSLGIGFDVDYDFLERLAQENHGLAQRIFGNQDTGAQLKEFYKKVSTPLLKDIIFDYPTNGISDVTTSRFHHYFGGDEIVVAGKVDAEKTPKVESLITATSAGDIQFLMETITEVEALNEFFAESKHAFPDFAKQYWAQLTINQLLAQRSLATTAEVKRTLTTKIMQLSITHHLVTPFTSLLIESEDGKERMLADPPSLSKGACCPTILATKSPVQHITTPKTPQTTLSPSETPEEARQLTISMIPKTECLIGKTPTPTCVDTDPHFIINLPNSQTDVCFNIDAQPGNMLNLLTDNELGIAINGKIITAKKAKDGKLNTYFGTFGLYFKQLDMKIEVGTEKITVKDASYSRVMGWSESISLAYKRLTVSVKKESNITITIDDNMTFWIILHRVWKNHPVNVDFLGLYFPSGGSFSFGAHGLIGQFMTDPEVRVYDVRASTDPEKPIATMNVKENKLTVTRGVQKEYQSNNVQGTKVTCWFVHNNGKGFIDGHYRDYMVPQLYSFLKRP